MPATLEQLTADAMTLPDKSRAVLAQRLIESLPADKVADVGDGYFLTADQIQEVSRRIAPLAAGALLDEGQFFGRLGN